MPTSQIDVGCAGWTIPAALRPQFPNEGSNLARYSAEFSCVEINSSFYRPHQAKTYARWSAAVPSRFRFSVKVPRVWTHEKRLDVTAVDIRSFLDPVLELGTNLGPLLIQIPPSLRFHHEVAARFLQTFRGEFSGLAALEPRHKSWRSHEAVALLREFRISVVGADPDPTIPRKSWDLPPPTAWPELTYFRLHGSPEMYYSNYSHEALQQIAVALREACGRGRSVWCIFDNTAAGAAQANALELRERLQND